MGRLGLKLSGTELPGSRWALGSLEQTEMESEEKKSVVTEGECTCKLRVEITGRGGGHGHQNEEIRLRRHTANKQIVGDPGEGEGRKQVVVG